jgi:hypothetical protein
MVIVDMNYIHDMVQTSFLPQTVTQYPDPKVIIPPIFNAKNHNDALDYILYMIAKHGPTTKIIYSWHSEGFHLEVIELMNFLGEILVTEHDISINNFIYVCAATPVQTNFDYYKKYCQIFKYLPKTVYFEPSLEVIGSSCKIGEPNSPKHLLNPHREKKFVFYNNGARPHRVIALAELYRKNLLNDCYLSFYDSSLPEKMIQLLVPNLSEQVINTHRTLLRDKLPISLTLKEDKENSFSLTNEDILIHQQSLFSLISETTFCNNLNIMLDKTVDTSSLMCLPNVLLTEKTWRTIKHKHPFVLLSNPYSLRALQEMGYKTFSPFINESYDEIENDEQRMIAVINEVERLCNMSLDDTKVWLENVHEITEYNFQFSLAKEFNTYRFETE